MEEDEIKRKVIEASSGIPELGKIGREIETIGVLPVPDSMRKISSLDVFIFWAMASASAATPLAGYLLYGVGIPNFLIIVSLATIIGLIPAGLFSEIGRQKPIVALIQARGTFGYFPANALSLLYTFVNMGWFGLNLAVGAEILSSVSGISFAIWSVILGIIQIVLVIFGAKWLNYFYKFTSPLLIISYGVLAFFLFYCYHPALSTMMIPSIPINWGLDINLILTFSILSWAYKITTITRFAKPYDRPSISYFLSPTLGIMLPVFLMGLLGYISQAATGNWNLAAVYKPGDPIWVLVAAVGASIAIIHTNSMNLYPAVADLLVSMETFMKRMKTYRLSQPLSAIVLGSVSIILAILGILNYVENFLLLVGDLILPFTFILIIDWYTGLRNSDILSFYYNNGLKVKALIALTIGFLLNYYNIYGIIGYYFPYQVIGSLIAAGIYYIEKKI
ncbi:purine-cytosine permease family protein [Acidianus ambivalens]|uniref:Thiamine permease n=1 Tax=Acidianus ambivalens TaxID=2283 RepID=A0A650CX31_ACIAM|nr:cytosine permease [Acidianus ambivalens]MQL54425.1 thiamine permease [Acidianus ambivalens]QGR22245.1 thiamine permease [Acidianus ambivalens]